MFDPSSHRFLNNQFIPNAEQGFLVVPLNPITVKYMIRFTLINPGRYNVGFTWEPNIVTAFDGSYLFPWAEAATDTNFLELGYSGDSPNTVHVQVDTRTLYGWKKDTGDVAPPQGILFQRNEDFPSRTGLVGFYGECIR